MLVGLGIQLVFLNACETGRAEPRLAPAQSATASVLVDAGIPAPVIATQFPMPEVGSHAFASFIYRSLFAGRSLCEAMREGRNALRFERASEAMDWGIPVLYTADPNLKLFAGPSQPLPGAGVLDEAVGRATRAAPGRDETRTALKRPVRVALCDIDAKVAWLPEVAAAANAVQSYFEFEVEFLPVPAGSIVRKKGVRKDCLLLSRIEQHLAHTPESFGADLVCCLTRHLVDNGDESDLFASSLGANEEGPGRLDERRSQVRRGGGRRLRQGDLPDSASR